MPEEIKAVVPAKDEDKAPRKVEVEVNVSLREALAIEAHKAGTEVKQYLHSVEQSVNELVHHLGQLHAHDVSDAVKAKIRAVLAAL